MSAIIKVWIGRDVDGWAMHFERPVRVLDQLTVSKYGLWALLSPRKGRALAGKDLKIGESVAVTLEVRNG